MGEYKNIVETSLFLFDIMGVNPLKRINKFRIVILLLMHLLMIYLVVLSVVLQELDLKLITDIVETTVIIIAPSAKLITLITNMDKARILLDNFESFWPVQQETESKYQQQLESLKSVIKIFVRLSIITAAVFLLRPLLTDDLALICYIPKFVPYFLFAFYNSCVFLDIMTLHCAYSIFAFSVIRILTLQFKMINDKLTKLEFDANCGEKIKSYVDYYNFLLKSVKTFNKFNRAQLLIEMQMFVICLLLEFLHLSKQVNLASIRVILVIACISITVVVLVCWPASELSKEIGRTVFCVYDSEWYNCTDLSIRKWLIIMMQSAQEDVTLTAGNFIKITMMTSTQIFKTAYSFFTFVSNMQN